MSWTASFIACAVIIGIWGIGKIISVCLNNKREKQAEAQRHAEMQSIHYDE